MSRIFVDTGFWFAFVDGMDPHHGAVVHALESDESRLVTSNYVFDESVTLCTGRLGHDIASRFGTLLLDPRAVDLVRLTEGDEADAWRLFLDRPDKGYSFTDCTSFVLMRRLGIGEALTLDEHFSQEGFVTRP